MRVSSLPRSSAPRRSYRAMAIGTAVTSLAIVTQALVGAQGASAVDLPPGVKSEEEIQAELRNVAPLAPAASVKGIPTGYMLLTADAVTPRISKEDATKRASDLGLAPYGGRVYDWQAGGSATPQVLMEFGLNGRSATYESITTYCERLREKCAFVGTLDEGGQYPTVKSSENLVGPGSISYLVSNTVTKSTSTTSGFSLGIKIGSGATGGLDFNNSTTSQVAETNNEGQTYMISVPAGKTGRLEARSHSGNYTGYLVVRELDESRNFNSRGNTLMVPARATVASEKTQVAMTFVTADAAVSPKIAPR